MYFSVGATYYYGTKMKYIAISINTTLDRATLGFPKGLPVRDNWEDFLEEEKKVMPPSLQGGFQITPADQDASSSLWHWLKIQEVNTIKLGLYILKQNSFSILL